MAAELLKLIPAEAQTIALTPKGQVMLKTVGEAAAFASLMAAGELLPPKVTVPSAVVAIIAGASVGLNPFESVQSIAVVNGRPALFGDGMKAVVQGSGTLESEHIEWFKDASGLRGAVRVTVKRKGVESPIIGEFSVRQAQQAGLWKKQGPWQQYPERMLLARARAFAYRDGFADVLHGIRSGEEEEDIALSRESEPVPVLSVPVAPVAQLPKPRRARRASASEIIEVMDTPDPALLPATEAKAPMVATMERPVEEADDFLKAS